jgi:hypothetical protein
VAVSGETLVAGAPFAGNGVAYVYQRLEGLWQLAPGPPLLPPTGVSGFGGAVAIDGGVIVVGATGSAHVFRRQGDGTWQHEDELTGDYSSGDLFGTAVAIDGNLVVVGAQWDPQYGSFSGAAYVFGFGTATGQWTSCFLASLPSS